MPYLYLRVGNMETWVKGLGKDQRGEELCWVSFHRTWNIGTSRLYQIKSGEMVREWSENISGEGYILKSRGEGLQG